MVLWEITLGTAYFLGLKRTYRLALKIQRKIIPSKRPKLREFLHRRTRNIFDIALNVHQNIQQRDIQVGRNLGNWILRWLDKMKPSAQIRGPPPSLPRNAAGSNTNITKQGTRSSHLKTPGSIQTSKNQDANRHLFTSSRNLWSKSFPTIAMMMQSTKPAGSITQYRQFSVGGPEMAIRSYDIGRTWGFEGVVRKDVMQYILKN